MALRLWSLLGLLFLLPVIVGCGGSDDKSNTTVQSEEGSATEDVVLKKVAAPKLPKLGDYLPPLDQRRIEIAPPAKWNILANKTAYLCSFNEAKGELLPAIVVKVSDPTIDDFVDVTEENVVDFAKALQTTLEKPGEDGKPKKPLEDAVALVLGSNAFARYVKKASANNLPVELQVLATIHEGRMYTIELRVKPATITAYRDQAYAVGAGLKFLGGSSNSTAPEETPADAPAKPAE